MNKTKARPKRKTAAHVVSQRWFCNTCYRNGSVRYGKHEDVYSVIEKIRQRHRTTSPVCAGEVHVVFESG